MSYTRIKVRVSSVGHKNVRIKSSVTKGNVTKTATKTIRLK